jgi:hypothetical protein
MAGLAERIHLDSIGGIAGDMFAASLADAFPELIPCLLAEVKKLPMRWTPRLASSSTAMRSSAGTGFTWPSLSRPRRPITHHDHGYPPLHPFWLYQRLIVASKCAASMKAQAKYLLPHLALPSPFFLPFDSRRLSTMRA